MFRKLFSNPQAWLNYIWLVYLPFNLPYYLPIKSWVDFFWLILIALFLVDYYLVYEYPQWHRFTMPIQLVITGSFVVFDLNFWMIVFTAWQVSSSLAYYPRKYFECFAVVFYIIVGIGIVRSIIYHSTYAPITVTFFSLLFVLISPILAYGISRGVFKQKQLLQTNRRLEAIVRKGERDRIARDLHDTLGQSFSMLTIKAELAKKLLVKQPDQVIYELNDIEQASRDNLQLVRNIVNNLHQDSLTEVILKQSQNLSDADIVLITDGEEGAREWPTTVQNQFAQVLPEAITNVIRHANAHEVVITFSQNDKEYQIIVRDDGRKQSFERAGSNGISGMKSRMTNFGGTFTISGDRHGTSAQFIIRIDND